MMETDSFSRIRLMIGEEKLQKLHNSFVIVAGLGAVGSYVVEALVRAGVGHLRLIDHDTINASNINRQLFALHSTLGKQKAFVAKERVLDINPLCKVEAVTQFIHKDTIPELFTKKADYTVDAIDSLNPKVELISYLYENNHPFISSLGAARRTDPLKVRIGPMKKVNNCRLGAFLRKRLKRRNIGFDFQCVYSEEVQSKSEGFCLPEPDENVTSDKRERVIMGSLPTITGIFGLILANEAIKKICQE